MQELVDYIVHHVRRSTCECGRCVDMMLCGDLEGETTNLTFFKVGNVGGDTQCRVDISTCRVKV